MSDYDLKLAIPMIRRKRMNFGLYKGEDANQVLITARPATAKQVADIETDCGDVKRILKGLCFWENEQLVFATKTMPAPAWEMMITKIFKEQKCAKFLPIVLRQIGAEESDEIVEDEVEKSAAPAAETPAPATAPPAPEAAATAPGVRDLKAQWLQLKAALTPRITSAVATNPPNKTQILALLKEGLEKEKSAGYAEATAAFKQIATLILGTAAPVATAPAADGGNLLAELNKLVPRIKSTIAAHPARKDEILKPVAAVQGFAKAGNMQEGTPALARVVALLDSLAAPSGGGGAEALAVWRDAKETADAQIEQLRGTLLKSGNPRLARIADKGITGGGLNALTGGRMVALWTALFDATNGALDDAKKGRARKAATDLRQFLAADQRIGLCENNPHTGPLKIRGTLLPALDRVEKMLA